MIKKLTLQKNSIGIIPIKPPQKGGFFIISPYKYNFILLKNKLLTPVFFITNGKNCALFYPKYAVGEISIINKMILLNISLKRFFTFGISIQIK